MYIGIHKYAYTCCTILNKIFQRNYSKRLSFCNILENARHRVREYDLWATT